MQLYIIPKTHPLWKKKLSVRSRNDTLGWLAFRHRADCWQCNKNQIRSSVHTLNNLRGSLTRDRPQRTSDPESVHAPLPCLQTTYGDMMRDNISSTPQSSPSGTFTSRLPALLLLAFRHFHSEDKGCRKPVLEMKFASAPACTYC